MEEKKDIIFGIIFIIFSIINYLVIIPLYVKGKALYGLDPNFFPKILTILFGIFSLALIISRWHYVSIHHININKKTREIKKVNYKIFYLIIIFIFYIVTFKHFGFLWATPVTLALLMFCFGCRNFKSILFYCLIITLSLFCLFEKILKIVLH